jgi:hypothetical protein
MAQGAMKQHWGGVSMVKCVNMIGVQSAIEAWRHRAGRRRSQGKRISGRYSKQSGRDVWETRKCVGNKMAEIQPMALVWW